MAKDQESLDRGQVVTQESGIQIIAYNKDDVEYTYRYVDVDSNKEVLRLRENTKNGLSTIRELDRKFWDVTIDNIEIGETVIEFDEPYKVHAILEDRVIEITTVAPPDETEAADEANPPDDLESPGEF